MSLLMFWGTADGKTPGLYLEFVGDAVAAAVVVAGADAEAASSASAPAWFAEPRWAVHTETTGLLAEGT